MRVEFYEAPGTVRVGGVKVPGLVERIRIDLSHAEKVDRVATEAEKHKFKAEYAALKSPPPPPAEEPRQSIVAKVFAGLKAGAPSEEPAIPSSVDDSPTPPLGTPAAVLARLKKKK